MDQKLVSWARAVKARSRNPAPTLWLFTDATRLPNPLPVIARLPKHLCGVVLRHDADPNRAQLARAIARLCRARHLTLTIAGNPALARTLNTGLHLRAGLGRPRPGLLNTASAHTRLELHRARKAGATAFLSPVFPTQSHPGAAALGPARFARLAGPQGAYALGGITGRTARALPRNCLGAGVIGAALPPTPP